MTDAAFDQAVFVCSAPWGHTGHILTDLLSDRRPVIYSGPVQHLFMVMCQADVMERKEIPIVPYFQITALNEHFNISKDYYEVVLRNALRDSDRVVVYTDVGMADTLSPDIVKALNFGTDVETRTLLPKMRAIFYEKLTQLKLESGVNLPRHHHDLAHIEDHPDFQKVMENPQRDDKKAEDKDSCLHKLPKAGSKWKHYSGRVYTVITIANEDRNPGYPVSVVYVGENGKTWVKTLANWYRTMTAIKVKKNDVP